MFRIPIVQQGACVQTFKCYSLSKYIKSWVWGHSIFKAVPQIFAPETPQALKKCKFFDLFPKCNNPVVAGVGVGGNPKSGLLTTPRGTPCIRMINRAPLAHLPVTCLRKPQDTSRQPPSQCLGYRAASEYGHINCFFYWLTL